MAEKILLDPSYGEDGIIVNNKILYACTLNQTDINTNKNKYYIIQLVDSNGTYKLFTRYGRIGEPGTSNKEIYSDLDDGCHAFANQFKVKTGNKWDENIYKNFVKKDKKYFLTTIDVSDVVVPQLDKSKEVPSQLEERLQNLIKLLSDKNMMKQSLINLNLDITKCPLGKIGKTQIANARKIISDINIAIDAKTNVIDLSSQFYTLIPVSVGRRAPPPIKTKEQIGKYTELLDELDHITITASIIDNNPTLDTIHPVDKIYNDLNAEIVPLEKDSKMWKIINQYVKIGPTHQFNVEVLDIFMVTRKGEEEIFNDYCKDIKNRMLLWHGSGLANWLSILKNNFRLPHQLKNVVITGSMFGGGVYFGDLFSKSFGYTRFDEFNGYACLELAEVALGKQHKLTQSNSELDMDAMIRLKCNSTFGMGSSAPEVSHSIGEIDVPAGDLKKVNFQSSLLYNEYIVYDVRQIHAKYIVLIKSK